MSRAYCVFQKPALPTFLTHRLFGEARSPDSEEAPKPVLNVVRLNSSHLNSVQSICFLLPGFSRVRSYSSQSSWIFITCKSS